MFTKEPPGYESSASLPTRHGSSPPGAHPCSSSVCKVSFQAAPHQTRTLQNESSIEENCESRHDVRLHEVPGSETEDSSRGEAELNPFPGGETVQASMPTWAAQGTVNEVGNQR